MEAPSGECLQGKDTHGVPCRLNCVIHAYHARCYKSALLLHLTGDWTQQLPQHDQPTMLPLNQATTDNMTNAVNYLLECSNEKIHQQNDSTQQEQSLTDGNDPATRNTLELLMWVVSTAVSWWQQHTAAHCISARYSNNYVNKLQSTSTNCQYVITHLSTNLAHNPGICR